MKKVKPCKLNELPPGLMGKMLVYKSGAIKLKLGSTLYDVSPGSDCTFAQDVAVMNTGEKHCCAIGEISKRVIVTPDIDDMISVTRWVKPPIGKVKLNCNTSLSLAMGVAAGAYILTLFAMKYRQRVLGLILVSPLCKEPSWTEWLCNKVMSNLLYFCGMCGVAKEMLLKRYYSKDIRGGAQFPESDIVKACRRSLDEMHSLNVWRFLEAINGRPDLSEGLRKLNCRSLIFVGDMSPFHSEALHITSKLDRRFSALVEVQACGSIVTEEQPHAMLIPIEYFLMGYGLYRQSKSLSPRSPLSPSWISPELFTPESMGLKLKPIKTRIPT